MGGHRSLSNFDKRLKLISVSFDVSNSMGRPATSLIGLNVLMSLKSMCLVCCLTRPLAILMVDSGRAFLEEHHVIILARSRRSFARLNMQSRLRTSSMFVNASLVFNINRNHRIESISSISDEHWSIPTDGDGHRGH